MTYHVMSLDITQCHERSVPKLSQLRDCESEGESSLLLAD